MLSIGTNITIEGNGATIIGSTPVMAFYILNCNGFVLRNLVIDWSPVPFTAGTISSLPTPFLSRLIYLLFGKGKVVNSTKYSLDIQVANGHVASNRTCEEITKYNGTTNYWYANIVWTQRTSKVFILSLSLSAPSSRALFNSLCAIIIQSHTRGDHYELVYPYSSSLICLTLTLYFLLSFSPLLSSPLLSFLFCYSSRCLLSY